MENRLPSYETTITRLSIPTPFRVGPVNCYLVEGQPLTLIDTGPNDEPSLRALERGLKARGHCIEDIERLLLTHQHYDHLGLAGEIKNRSGAEVVAHHLLASSVADFDAAMEAEDAYAEQMMSLHGVEAEAAFALRVLSRSFRRFGSSFRVDRALRDGDILTLDGIEIVVAMRPGHSPTDTVFIAETSGVAFVGDHLIGNISSNAVVHRPLDCRPDPRHRSSALAEYLDSLRLTAAMAVETLLPGHGEPIANHRQLVTERIEHHERRKERIYDELHRRSLTARDLTRVIWPRLPTDQIYLAISEVLGHCDLLIAERRIEEREQCGCVRFAARSD
jgi:glyoxylase-like metal-dependent hydrolase (beta-lactamase superfamily II)